MSPNPLAARTDVSTAGSETALAREPLGEEPQRQRVPVLDRPVRGVEQLEQPRGHADLAQLVDERLRAEVEVVLVALAGVDVDRPLRSKGLVLSVDGT